MTEPAEADMISLAMGRFDDRCPMANGRTIGEQRGTKSARRRRGMARFVHLLLPHLCLALITALFVSFVALIIRFVEAQNEREEQMQMLAELEQMRAQFIVHFRNKPIILGGDLDAESRAFVERVLRVGWTRGRAGIPLPAFDEDTTNDNNNNNSLSSLPTVWTLPNSLLFATSLVSRIGYGHIVPRTPEGKMLCQLFALIGCPLFLLLIADIGKAIANLLQILLQGFTELTRKICRKRTAKKNPITNGENGIKYVEDGPQQQKGCDGAENGCHLGTTAADERMATLAAVPFLFAFCALTAFAYAHLEGWHWLDCFYFSFISFFAIGYGDFAPSNCASVLFTICSVVIGMSIATLLLDFIGIEYIRNIHRIERTSRGKCCGREREKGSRRKRKRTSKSRKK
ncbi:hypothetical protein niasHT_015472 [Heterodera trifolii]|uniref:Potassium channel domain-containing protein n=1 Tax=Heterodera trifolii TaxID=157864 RepID=A0ABD2L146_9BILA